MPPLVVVTAGGFGATYAYAQAGGSDLAVLYDTPGDDVFVGYARSGRMTGAGYGVTAGGFGSTG